MNEILRKILITMYCKELLHIWHRFGKRISQMNDVKIPGYNPHSLMYTFIDAKQR